jgi:cytochrome P450
MTADLGAVFTRLPDVLRAADPYPYLAELRDESPYRAADGVVVLARHEHCAQVLRDPRTSSDRGQARIFATDLRPPSRKLVDLDPPEHTRIRRLVSRSLAAWATTPLAAELRSTVNTLLDAVPGNGFDVVGDLAAPLALATVGGLLGVPATDREQLGGWSETLSRGLYPLPLGSVEADAVRDATRAGARILSYCARLIADPAFAPGPVLAGLLGAGELSENEVLGICALLVNAGYETSVDLIGTGVRALLTHPSQLDRLRRDPGLGPAVVDEVLRWDSPAQLTTRVAAADLDIGGLRIAAGDFLVLLLGAANRDPAVFDRPDEFDISRAQAARHLAFAAGPHFCVGAGLGRLEGAVAFAAFATRVVAPELVPGPVPFRPTPSLRGPQRLRISCAGVRPALSAMDGEPAVVGQERRRA